MRLLYTLTAYPPSTGGAQLYAHQLARMFQPAHQVEVVSIWDTNRTDWLLGTTVGAPSESYAYDIDNIRVHKVGLSRKQRLSLLPYVLGYYPFMRLAVPQIARCWQEKLRPYTVDIDLIHNVRIGREPFSYASYTLAQEKDVPFALTPVHHPRWVGWRYRMYVDLYKRADLVFCLTESEREILVELGVSAERIAVTGMGPILASNTDPEQFLEKHKIDGPFVLFLGQHYAYKGFLQLLEATKLVWQKMPDVHFVFIGPPVGQSEQAFTGRSDRRIHRLGKVNLQEKSDALAACTMLCVPSIQESFGGVYTEAWAFGKPVIGGKINAISDVIDDEQNGYLVEQNKFLIAEKILDLCSHPEKAKIFGENGKKKLEDRYSWAKLAELTIAAYQGVL